VLRKEYIMSTVTVQLPETLAESLRREALPPDKAIIEALEEWLEKRRQEQAEEAEKLERVLEAMRSTGLWHSQEDQRTFIERLISTLGLEAVELPSHEELRQELAGVPPLSELIIAERDEGR
jgi:sugar-specific transcriptional regulator TrmB